jgi:putative transposase
MIVLVLGLWTFLRALVVGAAAVSLENVALRSQLAVLQRSVPRPKVSRWDRLFWIWLSRLWSGWRSTLVIVQPATVLAWHRRSFQLYWRWRSRSRPGGRPPIAQELRNLIHRMASQNPTWGRRRIQAELRFLGCEVAEITIARYMRRRSPRPSPTWRAFLATHCNEIAAVDFFVVPTLTFRLLFGFVVLHLQRRELLHVNVTDHPTAAWAAQQLVETFPEESAPKYLLRDRDAIYSDVFARRVKGLGMNEVLIAPRALAESFRRARLRFNSTRMPRSRHRDQRTASPTSAAQLPCVLQHHPPASVPPQPKPLSAGSTAANGRAHRRDSAGRRTSPPLPARRLKYAGFSRCTPRSSRDGGGPGVLRRPSVFSTQPFPAPKPAGSTHTLTSYGRQARPRGL